MLPLQCNSLYFSSEALAFVSNWTRSQTTARHLPFSSQFVDFSLHLDRFAREPADSRGRGTHHHSTSTSPSVPRRSASTRQTTVHLRHAASYPAALASAGAARRVHGGQVGVKNTALSGFFRLSSSTHSTSSICPHPVVGQRSCGPLTRRLWCKGSVRRWACAIVGCHGDSYAQERRKGT
jgi:hypothetical protein